jgi:signal transduction histidine kinase
VWAINPEHDHLSNLVYRMRRFATDLLGGQGMALRFQSSVVDHDLKVGANVRRQVYLIFKEAIHNIARHSGATSVDVELDRDGGVLLLRVSDDGHGFDVGAKSQGHGLGSMRGRAEALDGTVQFESSAQGTTVRVMVRVEAARPLAVLRGKRERRFR